MSCAFGICMVIRVSEAWGINDWTVFELIPYGPKKITDVIHTVKNNFASSRSVPFGSAIKSGIFKSIQF